ncbi:3469_t:CDS:2 [Cetraspora pellucida]|uniref:3469_t:CDS:1 n=1 Tax=Cetraspora pellucida TaxID=1433469 RepID=A0ACA9M7G3_9GLOM|nr:3469_t:CDS:2 [Cetraspora pellucida]
MSNNAFGSSFSDTYLNAYNEEQDVGAIFPNWESLENALKIYELEHQPKKKINDANHREKESKKVGCPWQLNAGCRKNVDAIIINKLIENHNHSLTPHRKEFASSLRSLSQEVLDDIKFLTQECNLGTKAQC